MPRLNVTVADWTVPFSLAWGPGTRLHCISRRVPEMDHRSARAFDSARRSDQVGSPESAGSSCRHLHNRFACVAPVDQTPASRECSVPHFPLETLRELE